MQRPENSNDTVSEGIGYGMLIAVALASIGADTLLSRIVASVAEAQRSRVPDVGRLPERQRSLYEAAPRRVSLFRGRRSQSLRSVR